MTTPIDRLEWLDSFDWTMTRRELAEHARRVSGLLPTLAQDDARRLKAAAHLAIAEALQRGYTSADLRAAVERHKHRLAQ